ncbi:MAG TPA: PfkB family carbohydrate kinase [Pirellulales bacterium]|nr:PfkB family carbohydrate kinase [Pirellulales bacterium]
MISRTRLDAILSTLPRLTIGLVGDLFLDRYLDLDPELGETSIETGLEAYQVTRVRNSPGALGTVMNNLAALGVRRLLPVTIVGDDGQAYDLLKELAKLPVDSAYIVQDSARLTPTYTKPMRRGDQGVWQELNRIDLRNNAPPRPETERSLLEQITKVFRQVDGLIVLDQVNEDNWGVITTGVREHLASLSRAHPDKVVLVDSRQRIGQFHFGFLKPNVAECLRALGRDERTAAGDLPFAREAALALRRHTGRPLFCTVGEAGILAVGFDAADSVTHVPGYPVAGPVDIVGAGDSATAGLVSALLSGASPSEAAALGNLVASITVQQLGTTGTASPEQLRARWRECYSPL